MSDIGAHAGDLKLEVTLRIGVSRSLMVVVSIGELDTCRFTKCKIIASEE